MYDVIVVGARCAGSPLAMLLARSGLRVLMVDRARLPSDTINGHLVKPAGAARLARWGLLDRVVAAGTPALRSRRLELGRQVRSLEAPPGAPPTIAPRRRVLDGVLLEAALAAGAEVRDRTGVRGVEWRDGRVCGVRLSSDHGAETVERAALVVGADGRHSAIGAAVGSEFYDSAPAATAAYWAYWTGVDGDAVAVRFVPRRMSGVFPTNDDQVLAFVAVPAAERFTGAELEARYEDELFRFEGVREAFAAATRASRVLGMVDLPNFFRVSSGPGWALAGDAGHHKDPLVARGISDAFRDADALAEAITSSLERGPAHLDAALAAYAALRDAACRDVYRLNLMIASSELSSMERTAELYAALADAESAADARFGVDLPALAPA